MSMILYPCWCDMSPPSPASSPASSSCVHREPLSLSLRHLHFDGLVARQFRAVRRDVIDDAGAVFAVLL